MMPILIQANGARPVCLIVRQAQREVAMQRGSDVAIEMVMVTSPAIYDAMCEAIMPCSRLLNGELTFCGLALLRDEVHQEQLDFYYRDELYVTVRGFYIEPEER